MYFEDLTPYSYCCRAELAGVLNIGWLHDTHAFVQGEPPKQFVSSLKQWLIGAKANQTRGYHQCRFCPHGEDILHKTIIGDHTFNLGSAEIWIPSAGGAIFAAPNLIVHYVEKHRYIPPMPFIDAVLKPIISTWNAQNVVDEMIRKRFIAKK